jgi:hypothetical protein
MHDPAAKFERQVSAALYVCPPYVTPCDPYVAASIHPALG